MPRKSGLETLAEIKQHPVWKSIPVLMLTASRTTNDVAAAYGLQRLKEQLAELLGHRHADTFQSWQTATPDDLVARLEGARNDLERRVSERTEQWRETNRALLEEIDERRRKEARVRHLLAHDSLTNLPNRLLLVDRLE